MASPWVCCDPCAAFLFSSSIVLLIDSIWASFCVTCVLSSSSACRRALRWISACAALTLLHRHVELALLFLEFALLFQRLRLCLLSLGDLGIGSLEHLLHLREMSSRGLQFGGDRLPSLPLLLRSDLAAGLAKSLRHFLVHRGARTVQLFLLAADFSQALPVIGLLGRQLVPMKLPFGRKQRRGEGLGKRDFVAAFRANDERFC